MAKCAICKKNVETTFLDKPAGTIIYDDKNKKQMICSNCQKAVGNDRKKLLEKIH